MFPQRREWWPGLVLLSSLAFFGGPMGCAGGRHRRAQRTCPSAVERRPGGRVNRNRSVSRSASAPSLEQRDGWLEAGSQKAVIRYLRRRPRTALCRDRNARLRVVLLHGTFQKPSVRPVLVAVRAERGRIKTTSAGNKRPPPWICSKGVLIRSAEIHVLLIEGRHSKSDRSASGSERAPVGARNQGAQQSAPKQRFWVTGHWHTTWNHPHCGARIQLERHGDFNANGWAEWIIGEAIQPAEKAAAYLGTAAVAPPFDLKQARLFLLEQMPAGLKARLRLHHVLTPRVDEFDQSLCGRREGSLKIQMLAAKPKPKPTAPILCTIRTFPSTCSNPYAHLDSCAEAGLSEAAQRECEQGCQCSDGKKKRRCYRWDGRQARWTPIKASGTKARPGAVRPPQGLDTQ